MAAQSGIPLDQCPTCLSKLENIDGYWGRVNGTYRYNGEEHPCDCEQQIALRKHYLVSGIPDQYQRLDWTDFRDQSVKDDLALYLGNWESFRLQGMGLEFSSPQLGTGKTFCATYVAKELVKRGVKAYFMPFLEVVSLYQEELDERKIIEDRLKGDTALVLDEVVPPYTGPQAHFFAAKLEEIVRHRTNFNRVTIMTTNLDPGQLHHNYPRVYSLLEAKQVRIELAGDDARQSIIKPQNLAMVAAREVRPIT